MITQAFILGGGLGTRLRPITYELPKMMIPLQGKPLIHYPVELCAQFGVKHIVLGLGYKAGQIMSYFGNGSMLGIRIDHSVEDEWLGTAGALRLARPLLNDKKPLIMSNGDELKDINLADMQAFHKENNALATLALTQVEDVTPFGVAELDGDRIKRFVEKPSSEDAPSQFISCGLYILEPEVLDLIPEGNVSIERDIWPIIAEQGRLFGFKFSGQFFATDSFERYENALKNWKGFSFQKRR